MAPPRLPTTADFPSSLTLTITPPAPSHPATNILILLHGFGDTHLPFTQLARTLNLPETVCISLRGPNPIPPLFTGSDTPALHWADDVFFDQGKGDVDWEGGGFQTSRSLLIDVIVDEVLMAKCGYRRRDILFFGFGQGGMAALDAVASATSSSCLGGIVSIGACLPATCTPSSSTQRKNKTPTLILAGSRSSHVTQERLSRTKSVYQEVEYVKWSKAEDSMPRNREEMLPIMHFFARRLRSLAGVPEGAMEVS